MKGFDMSIITLYVATDDNYRVINSNGDANETFLKVGSNTFSESNILHVWTYLYLFDMLVHENVKYVWEFGLDKEKQMIMNHPISNTITHVYGDIEFAEPRRITFKSIMDLNSECIPYHTPNLGAVVWACRHDEPGLLEDVLKNSPLLTPAECAQYTIQYDRDNMMDVLVEKGLRPWDTSTRVLDMCWYHENRNMLKRLLEKYSSDVHDPILLYNISGAGYHECVKLMLKHSKYYKYDRYTKAELDKALGNSASNGWVTTSKILIEYGADTNVLLKYPEVYRDVYKKW
jgi:hypothetical protein